MKIFSALNALFILTNCLGQTVTPNQPTAAQTDSSSPAVIFFDGFNDNKNNWEIVSNKNISTRIDGGIYYVSAERHAHGTAQEIKIDTRKDFEIETRIKILSGGAEHKNYYSMLFWGREAMDAYYLTFSKDGFASVQVCDGKKQSDCMTKNGSLKKNHA